MEDSDASLTFNPTEDISTQLTQRYSTSSAPQHRHLIATAAAIKSVIVDTSPALPLTPLSYFAAIMSSLSPPFDAVSSSSLSTLLSIVLPLVPQGSISPGKASEAVDVLVEVLDYQEKVAGSTCNARCVVKCLGLLLLFCDIDDWSSLELPLKTLLNWSLDKRPKVRKCALVYLENALKRFRSGSVTKKASKLILSLLGSHISAAVKSGVLTRVDGSVSESERQHEGEHLDLVHVLCIVRVALPYLSQKISVQTILKVVELLDARYSEFTRLILNAIEAFLDKAEPEGVTKVAEDIVHGLSSYISSKTSPDNISILAANLLKVTLDKTHIGDPEKWNKCLPQGVKALAGLLTFEDDIASNSSIILKNLINQQFSGIESLTSGEVVKNGPELIAIQTICSVLMGSLDSFAGIPNKHALAVLCVLFLKLGRNSLLYMKTLLVKLGEIFIAADGKDSDLCHLQKCFGCAIVAVGAENILGLVPISFNVESSTCSNVWLVPLLKKYVSGASLKYFMEHVAPIAKSLHKASRKVRKSVIGQDLQAHARALWGLLPAFCLHPTDIGESFQSFAKLLLVQLKKDASVQEDIADAIQILVRQFKCLHKFDAAAAEPHSSDILLEDYLLEKRRLPCYSKKDANKNLKALSLHSNELLQAFMIAFLDSPPNKRSSIKKAISCIASILNSSITKKIFVASLERFPAVKNIVVCRESDLSDSSLNDIPSSVNDKSQWSLTLDLASSVVEGADEDLVALIFRLTKTALEANDGINVCEAYYTLSCILEEHPWFCSSKLDELVVLVSGLKSPADIASFRNRLSCFRLLLVCALKSTSNVENTKSFPILNDIILALKDSNEEARKAVYDMVLEISSHFRESSTANPDGPYYRLINMILGYLSGPSPHITSAAVSALSVLVFKEPELCVRDPNLVSSVTSLLNTKAVEVIKAVLGFVKVLVSCLEAKDLQNFVSTIMDGLLPWTSVSRHHFRSKVTVILEIMIRKCGFPAVKMVTPERYQPFIKKVSLNRHGRTTSNEKDLTEAKQQDSDVSAIGSKKRGRNASNSNDCSSDLHRQKRPKLEGNYNPRDGRSKDVGPGKKSDHFRHRNTRVGHEMKNLDERKGKPGRASAGPQKKHGRSGAGNFGRASAGSQKKHGQSEAGVKRGSFGRGTAGSQKKYGPKR